MERREQLEQEATYLHAAFFDDAGDNDTINRYVAVHEHFQMQDLPQDRRLLDILQANNLDVEAVEYVLRLRNRNNALTRKVEILHYLAECQPQRSGDFINDKDERIIGWTRLFCAAGRMFFCLIYGSYLARKYDLA